MSDNGSIEGCQYEVCKCQFFKVHSFNMISSQWRVKLYLEIYRIEVGMKMLRQKRRKISSALQHSREIF